MAYPSPWLAADTIATFPFNPKSMVFSVTLVLPAIRGIQEHMHRQGMVSIWFFIGALLLALRRPHPGRGIYELSNPPAHPVVRADLHAGIWWGALLLILGAVYSVKFRPGKL